MLYKQLLLVIWKNVAIRRRQKARLAAEVLWPLLLFLILMWVRTRGLQYRVHSCHFESKAMPSAGLFSFVNSFVCSFNNTCHAHDPTPSLIQRRLEKLSVLVDDVTRVITNVSHERQPLSWLPQLVETLRLRRNDTLKVAQLSLGDLLTSVDDGVAVLKRFDIGVNDLARRGFLTVPIRLAPLISLGSSLAFLSLVANTGSTACNSSDFSSLFTGKQLESNSPQYVGVDDAVGVVRDICQLEPPSLVALFAQFTPLVDSETSYTTAKRLFRDSFHVEIGNGDWANVTSTLEMTLDQIRRLDSVKMVMNSVRKAFFGDQFATALNISEYVARAAQSLGLICGFDAANFFSPSLRDNQYLIDKLRETIKQRSMRRQLLLASSSTPEPAAAVDSSSRCRRVVASMEADVFSGMFWRAVKPMAVGKILYTPPAPAVEKLVRRMNITFSALAYAADIVRLWPERITAYAPVVRRFAGGLQRFYTNIWSASSPDSLNTTLPLWDEIVVLLDLDSNSNDQYSIDAVVDRVLNKTASFCSDLAVYLRCVSAFRWESAANETQLELRGRNLSHDGLLWGGIVFMNISQNMDRLPAFTRYKIRMDADRVDSTKNIMDRLSRRGSRQRPYRDLKYITFGYAYLQDIVERAIVEEVTDRNVDTGIFFHQMPYPCYIDDEFIKAISRTFPMFMVLSWLYPAAMIIKSIVYEKESRLKEVMLILGLDSRVHWLGTFIVNFLLMLASDILLSFILVYGKVLQYSDPSIVFLFLAVYSISTVCFSFMLSTLFYRANIAAAAGGIIFFISYIPYPFLLLWRRALTAPAKRLWCLLSNVAFGFGCASLARLEERGVGVQWHNIGDSIIGDSTFSLLDSMMMMLVDSAVYCILAWYVNAVWPGGDLLARVWYFPVSPGYWRAVMPLSVQRNQQQSKPATDCVDLQLVADQHVPETSIGASHVEVNIRNLRKVYGNGRVAVDDLSVKFYRDQITCFLGHNGAGKTTTISILTGLIGATAGEVTINGLDITRDLKQIRKQIGFCPQYNVLFDDMTVLDHFMFYARLKNCQQRDNLATETDEMLSYLGLSAKRHHLAKHLSGGMKRKLSIAVAFIGDPSTVILDEPTAGVDACARRQIWQLLLKQKHGRTVVMTTHLMDEADVLADRVVVISRGKLLCCGTSLHLKREYGAGYRLTLVHEQRIGTDNPGSDRLTEKTERQIPVIDSDVIVSDGHVEKGEEETTNETGDFEINALNNTYPKDQHPLTSRQIDTETITNYIRQYINDAYLVEKVGPELRYSLPYSRGPGQSNRLILLTEALDADLKRLGLTSYGLSDTTLEEVFFALTTNQNEADDVNPEIEPTNRPSTSLDSNREICTVLADSNEAEDTDYENDTENCHLTGEWDKKCQHKNWWPMWLRHVHALLLKRFHHGRRDVKGLFSELVLPALFVCLAMMFTVVAPPVQHEPPLPLTPWLFKQPLVSFFSDDTISLPSPPPSALNMSQVLLEEMISARGIGTYCLKTSHRNCNTSTSDIQRDLARRYVPPSRHTGQGECSCDTGSMQCHSVAAGPPPARAIMPSGDLILNITGYNASDWLLKTRTKYERSRWGGFAISAGNGRSRGEALFALSMRRLSLTLFNTTFNSQLTGVRSRLATLRRRLFPSLSVDIWYNNKGWPTSVVYLNALNNALLRSLVEPASKRHHYGIECINHPLNLTSSQAERQMIRRSGITLLHAVCVVLALSFVPASFTVHLVDERVSRCKHVQLVSGVSALVYWLAETLWCLAGYTLSALLCVLIFVAFDQPAYVAGDNLTGLVSLLLLYGWACVPLMFSASFVFTSPATAFVTLACVNLFIGTVSTVATFVLQMFDDDAQLRLIGEVLRAVFLVFPQYCLGRGLIDMAGSYLQSRALSAFVGVDSYLSQKPDVFAWDLLGSKLTCLAIHGCVGFSVNILCEYYQHCCCLRSRTTRDQITDSDDKVDGATDSECDPLRMTHVTKVYGQRRGCGGDGTATTAVSGLTMRVRRGECVGLLGVNGAGKTTTFRLITGDLACSHGEITISGRQVSPRHGDRSPHCIGYCPQSDALLPLLSAREHVQLWLRLCGVCVCRMGLYCERWLRRLAMDRRQADTPSSHYSGGQRRRLSTVLALIGEPALVLLDEPTSGMDPTWRRRLWQTCRHQGGRRENARSMLLSSHSLDECEQVCSRVVLLAPGARQIASGSIQQLKSKYGDVLTVTVRSTSTLLTDNGSECDNVTHTHNRLLHAIPSAKLYSSHHLHSVFHVPPRDVTVSQILRVLEALRVDGLVEHFSLSQATLDDIFVRFASEITGDSEIPSSGLGGPTTI